MTTTTNMGLTQSTVGTTTGPDWATNAENNLLTLDAHDHTSGKGVQLTPSSLNINADLEFNLNSATELKNVVLDNAVHASASGDTNNSVYEYDGNLYWRNASGGSVQITSGTAVNTSGGSISGMTGNAQVLFSSNSYAFKFDSSLSDPGIAKISHADIDLYKYDAAGSAAKITLKFLGTGTSAALTVPDETGTLLTTATSFAGTINVATSSSNAPINLKPNGTGHVAVGNGGASGKLTSNGAFDLVLDTNSGTNSGTITITDGTDGEITIDTNGTGDINLTAGADVNIPLGIGLTFGNDGEKIEGNGTKLDIAASELDFSIESGGDINIGTDIGLTFGNDGEKIEGNGTKLDIAAAELDFSIEAGGDINIGADIGLTFGDDGEKIEGDGTNLTVSSSNKLIVNTGAVVDAVNFDSNTLSIDASNNRIGIGTAAPEAKLDVKVGSAGSVTAWTEADDLILESNTTAGMSILTPDGSSARLVFGSPSANQGAALFYRQNLNKMNVGTLQSGGALALRSGADVDALYIDGNQNVGIGTTSVNAKFHLSGSHASAGDPLAIIQATDNDHTGIGLMAYGSNASQRNWLVAANLDVAGSFGIGYTANDSDVPTTANVTNALSIDSSGNVGIGTTSPSCALHVHTENSASTNYLVQRWGNSTSTHGYVDFQLVNPGSTASGFPRLDLEIGNANIMSFVRGGNVGIGTTNPSSALTVNGGSSANVINIEGRSSDDYGIITWYTNDGTTVKGNIQVTASDDMIFRTGPSSNRLTIGSSGDITMGGNMSIGDGVYVSTTGTSATRRLSSSSSGSSPITLYWGNTTVNTTSDVRLKENITDTEINGLEKINQLQVKDFTWNDPTDTGINNRNVRGKWTGLIAQEIINVLPFTVNAPRDELTLLPIQDATTDDGEIVPWNVEFGYMVPVLVKAIQELSAKVTALEGA